MTPEQQRIAIAEACGWTEISMHFMWGLPPTAIDYGTEKYLKHLPDYINDLNAMHEAEKMLWETNWRLRYDFVDHLARVINPIHGYRMQDGIDLLDATAAQRAEAFLKTLNLWKP